mgnify:CR=1 FL=1
MGPKFALAAGLTSRLLARAGAAAAYALFATATAQAQETAAASANAELIANLSLAKTQDMDFGLIVAPNAGRVDMTAEASATCTANNGLVHSGACLPAGFGGVSTFGLTLRIQMPPGRRLFLSGPGTVMRINRLAPGGESGLSFVGRTGRNYRYLVTDPAGTFAFFVGGRLRVANGQVPGTYTGTFDVTVDYN